MAEKVTPDQLSAAAAWAEATRQRQRADRAELRAARAERLAKLWAFGMVGEGPLAVEALERLAGWYGRRKGASNAQDALGRDLPAQTAQTVSGPQRGA